MRLDSDRYPISKAASLLGVYGVAHAVVDAASAALLFGAQRVHALSNDQLLTWIILYNLLAFGLQPVAGWLADRFCIHKAVAMAGMGLCAAASLVMPLEVVSAVALAGMGNAMFHVGAGAIAVSIRPERATAPGIFVAPGAVGLGLGIWIGRGGMFSPMPFVIALALVAVATWLHSAPAVLAGSVGPSAMKARWRRRDLAVTLLLLSVAVRSYVGFTVGIPFRPEPAMAWALMSAAFFGKLFGGLIGDRIGWLKTAVGALLLSAPLILFNQGHGALAVVGMTLFQMTMPVTLVATVRSFPGRPAFGFGLTCLALVLGALPIHLIRSPPILCNPIIVATLIAVSVASLYVGLLLFQRREGEERAGSTD